MSPLAWKDEAINTYVRDLITPVLQSSYAKTKPLLAFLAGSSTTGLDKLGAPSVGAFYGGKAIGMGERQTLNGSKTHVWRYQKGQTDAASNVAAGAATPTSTLFAEDNVGTIGVNWTSFWCPIKVREDSVLNAQNAGSEAQARIQIASVIEEAVAQGFQRMLEKHQAQLWTGTLTSAQQDHDTQTWGDYIGVQHWCDDGVADTDMTHVGGVARTTHTELKGNVTTGVTTILLRKCRQARLTTAYGAIRQKYASAGNLIITTPTLWEKLANEADGKNQINSNDIPQFARAGFTNPAIRLYDALIVWDHDCPSGEVYVLTPEFWVFEVQRGANFMIEPWTRKWVTEEGGAFYRWTTIRAKTRLTCRRPDLQVKLTDVTAGSA